MLGWWKGWYVSMPLLFATGMHSHSCKVCQPALAQQTGQLLSSMRRWLSPSSTQASRCWASAWYCLRLSSICAKAAAFSTASLRRRHRSPIFAFHLLTLPWHTRLIRNHLILPCTTRHSRLVICSGEPSKQCHLQTYTRHLAN